MHPIFQHPYILLEKKREILAMWFNHIRRRLCGNIRTLLLGSLMMDSLLEQCLLRKPIGRFMYPFENMRQVNLVLNYGNI
jgi:hypothetical protein